MKKGIATSAAKEFAKNVKNVFNKKNVPAVSQPEINIEVSKKSPLKNKIMLPLKYSWLNSIKAPKVIIEALKEYGTLETPGTANNKKIIAWAAEINKKVQDAYKADSIPWCGLFVGVIVKRAGYNVVTDPLWALNWGTFGNRVDKDKAAFGDVLVFVRNGGGHVAFYIGEDATTYYVLGGNQSDSVNITRIAKNRLYAVRRCPWSVGQPTEVKKIFLSSGEPISQNEQ